MHGDACQMNAGMTHVARSDASRKQDHLLPAQQGETARQEELMWPKGDKKGARRRLCSLLRTLQDYL